MAKGPSGYDEDDGAAVRELCAVQRASGQIRSARHAGEQELRLLGTATCAADAIVFQRGKGRSIRPPKRNGHDDYGRRAEP